MRHKTTAIFECLYLRLSGRCNNSKRRTPIRTDIFPLFGSTATDSLIPHQRFQPAHYRIPTRFLSLLPPRRCTHNLSYQATTSEAFHLVSSELQCIVLLHQTTTILYPLLETLSNHNLTLYTFFAVQLYCSLLCPQRSAAVSCLQMKSQTMPVRDSARSAGI